DRSAHHAHAGIVAAEGRGWPRSAAWASTVRGSSTRHRSDCGMLEVGISIPSALAVLRLTIVSNLVARLDRNVRWLGAFKNLVEECGRASRKRSLEWTCRSVAFVPLSGSCTAGSATLRCAASVGNSDVHPGQSIIP